MKECQNLQEFLQAFFPENAELEGFRKRLAADATPDREGLTEALREPDAGEQIRLFDETGSHHYVFGLEESYGCLAGTYARDKDAPVAVMMLCEVAAYYKLQGKTLWDAMVELYEKYGYYKEDLATVTLKGIDGSQKITAMMNAFRENPPKELGGFKVLACRDYKSDCRRDMITGETTSNVLYYELENNAWCCVRPSGTEPKIKYYFGVKGENFKDAEEKLEAIKKAMTE